MQPRLIRKGQQKCVLKAYGHPWTGFLSILLNGAGACAAELCAQS